jgi:Tfp pilus assembly protein PilV
MKIELKLRHRSYGQGMTEYIIVVALIAIAATGVYSYLGKTVRNQTAAVANGLAGQKSEADTARGAAKESAAGASEDANKVRGLSTFTESTGVK